MHIKLITGVSGSGKSVALRILEDNGYFCVDNLPPCLLLSLVCIREHPQLPHRFQSPLAVSIDARSADSLASLSGLIEQLRKNGHNVQVIFLTAKTATLIARFSETGRAHPLSHRLTCDKSPLPSLELCIAHERRMLEAIQEISYTIDTSYLSAKKLSNWIQTFVPTDARNGSLYLIFESFGFKHGIPLDADFIFDVRILANPHYDPSLRKLTGHDLPVIQFLSELPEAMIYLSDIRALIEKWLPAFKQNNRYTLTIAIGCTGGQHRSVFMVEQLAAYFESTERVVRRHREL